ncbi:MAG: extracellular solute-binding protein [Thermoflexales bacterium]|nr:extracellular solute-binding protein [Thermoflexales bacterium]
MSKMVKLLSVVLAAAMVMGLVACSGGGAAPTTAPKPAEQRVFKVWHYEAADSAMGASWDDALKDFQAKYPDVKVEFELKTFDQIQQTAQMILNSAEAPDAMEINKGNATAGLYAKQGLLTDITAEATKRGWDKIMSPSIQTTCRYDTNGIMGSGPLYGVTTYGEFVMVYYNKDMFAKQGVKVPTSLEEFEAVADSFVKAGITPIAIGALDKWPVTQNFYELALYKADRDFVNKYELFQGDLDFHGPEFTFAAERLNEHFKKGYYLPTATGTSYDDANLSFMQGTHPMNLTGSWMFGTFLGSITDFDWGLFAMPGKKLNTGSGGNLWVVPAGAKNKDLAYEFIDLTLQKKAQTVMANKGGIPLNADLSQVTDSHVKELNQAFSTLVQNDGLAFYPDWPAPGYMDVLGGGLQELIGGTKTPSTFLDAIAGPWKEYKDTLP